MIKVKRWLIFMLFSVFMLFTFFAYACGKDANLSDIKKPAVLEFSNELATESNTMQITLDDTGLFNKVKGIESVTSGIIMPQIFAGREQRTVVEKGVRVVANASGAELLYTKVVDLKTLTDDLICFEVLCNEELEMKKIEVLITDIYDVNNKITIQWWRHPNLAQQISYMLVTVNNNVALGRDNETDTDKLREEYGSIVWDCGFNEKLDNQGFEHQAFNLKYDYNTNQIFSRIEMDGSEYMVLDCDDEELGSAAFNGFTTGEVYVSIKFTDIVKKGGVAIHKLGGEVLESSDKTTVAANNIKVKIDRDYFDNNLPAGAVNYIYKIPEPITTDYLQGNMDVKTEIFLNGKLLNCDIVNNSFTPTVAGAYKIVYSAKDVNDLMSKREFDVTINENPLPIIIEKIIDQDNFLITTNAKLPVFIVSGGSGKLSTSVEYFYNNDKVDSDPTGKLFLFQKGTVKTVLTVTDYIGQIKVDETVLNVLPRQQLVYEGKLFAVKAGNTVTVPDFEAIDFTLDENEIGYYMNKKIYIDGELLDDSRTFIVPTDRTVLNVKYVGENSLNSISENYTINIIAPEQSGNVLKYFINKNFMIKQVDTGISLKTNSAENSLSLPYSVSTELLSFKFESVKDRCFYDYIEIRLEDYRDSSISVSIRIKKAEGGYVFCLQDENGDFTRESDLIKKNLNEQNSIIFYYDRASRALLGTNYQKIIDVVYCENSDYFVGFTSGGAFVGLSIATKQGYYSEVLLNCIGNQVFTRPSYEYGDLFGPEITFFGDIINCKAERGETKLIPSAAAFDILQGISQVYVSLKSPNGDYLINNVLADRDYYVNLELYGNYSVLYKTKDSEFNYTERVFFVNVSDMQAPVISINGEYKENYRSGEKMTIYDYTVQDNLDNEEKINVSIIVYTPSMQTYFVKVGDEVVLNELGQYDIIYVATDSSSNITRIHNSLVVG